MINKKLLLMAICSFVLVLNLTVKADSPVKCNNDSYRWVAGSWGNGTFGTTTNTSGEPTCKTTGTEHTETINTKCKTKLFNLEYNCYKSRTWKKKTPSDCCCSGTTSKKYDCGTCNSGACATHKLSFIDPPKRLSHGTSVTLSVSLPTGVTGWTLTVTDGTSYVSKNGHTITVNNTSNQCQTIKLESSKTNDNSYNYTNGTATITAYPSWSDEGVKKMSELTNQCTTKYEYSKEDADKNGKNEYRIDCKNEGDSCKCHVYKRGCGDDSKPTPACYIDKEGYMRWGVYSFSRKACLKNGNYVVCSGGSGESAVPKDKCKNDTVCKTDKPSASSKSTTCNGQGDNSGTYTKYCKVPAVFNSSNTAEDQYFYKIDCEELIYTEFKGPSYDWSLEESNNAYLYPATGFKYMLAATSRLQCNGKFYKGNYDKYLNYIINYSSQYASLSIDDGDKVKKMSDSMVADFAKTVAGSYINWDPNYTFDAKVVITDLVAQANNETPYSVELVKNKATSDVKKNTSVCGELIKDTTVKLTSDNKIDYGGRKNANFSYEKKQYFEKIVPEACLNPSDGTISYGGTCSDDYSLGAQFFIMSNRDVIDDLAKKKENYNYRVDVTNMGFTGESNKYYASNKTQCRLEVLDNQIIYRHVDPNDAFLQKSKPGRTIGLNWLNKKYDFTKIVKMETWHQSPLYNTIRLDTSTNKEIKALTSGNNASVFYVQKCKDTKTKICQLVNSARTGTR